MKREFLSKKYLETLNRMLEFFETNLQFNMESKSHIQKFHTREATNIEIMKLVLQDC